MEYNAEYFEELLGDLESQIKSNHKPGILKLYDELQKFDIDSMPDWLLDEYDDLIDKANEFLYETA